MAWVLITLKMYSSNERQTLHAIGANWKDFVHGHTNETLTVEELNGGRNKAKPVDCIHFISVMFFFLLWLV